MRFLAVSDLHGRAIEVDEKFDAILAVGDYCDYSLFREEIFERGEVRRSTWRKNVKSVFDSGKKVLEWLDSFGVPVFAIPGNTDLFGVKSRYSYERMVKGLKNVVDINFTAVDVNGFRIIGYGGFGGPEIEGGEDLEEFEELLDYYMGLADSKKYRILLSHVPPYGSGLDKVRMRGSPARGRHVGSFLSRYLLKEGAVELVLSGHVHESMGKKRLGKGRAVNIGPGFKGRYAIVSAKKRVTVILRKGKVRRI